MFKLPLLLFLLYIYFDILPVGTYALHFYHMWRFPPFAVAARIGAYNLLLVSSGPLAPHTGLRWLKSLPGIQLCTLRWHLWCDTVPSNVYILSEGFHLLLLVTTSGDVTCSHCATWHTCPPTAVMLCMNVPAVPLRAISALALGAPLGTLLSRTRRNCGNGSLVTYSITR